MPDTLSDSWTSDEMSAIADWRVAVSARRRLPTRRETVDEERQHGEAEQREPPVEQHHRDRRRDHRRHVLGDRRRGGGDDVLHAADVVGDARLHLARARLGEERERQPLQVPVDGGAQVVHDLLADASWTGRSGRRRARPWRSRRRSSRRPAAPSSSLSRSGSATSRISRSRNGETMPRPALMTISPSTVRQRPPVRREERRGSASAGSPRCGASGADRRATSPRRPSRRPRRRTGARSPASSWPPRGAPAARSSRGTAGRLDPARAADALGALLDAARRPRRRRRTTG